MALSNDTMKLYAKACSETGQVLGIEVFDTWTEMQKENVSSMCVIRVCFPRTITILLFVELERHVIRWITFIC